MATKPPTLTSACLPKTTPLLFTNTTWPGALIAPLIIDLLAPLTTFSVLAAAFGWLKLTVASLPTLNDCQFTTARCEVWFTFITFPDWEIAAFPAVTLPPVGNALDAIVPAKLC